MPLLFSQSRVTDSSVSKRKNLFAQWAKILLIVIISLGILFRFAQLDNKVYWPDEAATSLRISGFTLEELKTDLIDGPELSTEQMLKYQYPNAEKGVTDTIRSIVVEDPQHPPLFFLLLRNWVNLFGHSLVSLRSLAAVFSLLMLPAVWWLCQELFQSRTVSWIAVALLSVSPVQVIYAQEARHYSLWMLLTALSSAALLKALRVKTLQSWTAYSLSVALGLYTHLFFGLVAIGHGIYTLAVSRLNRDSRNYLLSSGIALLSFVPWLLILFNREDEFEGVSWMDQATSLPSFLIRFVGILSRTFVDLGVSPTDSLFSMLFVSPLVLLTVGFSLLALAVVVRRTPFRVWFFLITLCGVTSAVIFMSYLVSGKVIAVTRYALPIALGMHIATAYLLAESFRAPSRLLGNPPLWRTTGAVLLSAGVLSCFIRSGTPVWWNQLPEFNRETPNVAQVLNQHPNALVMVDASSAIDFNMTLLQGLVHSVHQDLDFRVILETDPASLIQPSQRDTFVYFPFIDSIESLEQRIATKYSTQPNTQAVSLFDSLWQVVPVAKESDQIKHRST